MGKSLFILIFTIFSFHSFSQVKRDKEEAFRTYLKADSILIATDTLEDKRRIDLLLPLSGQLLQAADHFHKKKNWLNYVKTMQLFIYCDMIIQQNTASKKLTDSLIQFYLPKISKDSLVAAELYYTKGLFLHKTPQSKFTERLNCMYKVLDFVGEHSKNHFRKLSKVYFYLGVYNFHLGYYAQAHNYYQKALELTPSSTQDYRTLHNNLAISYLYIFGSPNYALDFVDKAIQLNIEKYGSNHHSLINNYFVKGKILTGLLRYNEAMDAYQKSILLCRKQEPTDYVTLQFIYLDCANLFKLQAKPDSALSYIQRTLELQPEQKTFLAQQQLEMFMNKMDVFMLTQQRDSLYSNFNNATRINKDNKDGKDPQFGQLYLKMGDYMFKNRQWEEALYMYQQSINYNSLDIKSEGYLSQTALHSFLEPNLLLKALFGKANIFAHLVKNGQPELQIHCLNLYKKCDSLVQTLRLNQLQAKDQYELNKTASLLYEQAVDFCIYLGEEYKVEAFYFSERNKANFLSQLINESAAKKNAGIADEWIEKDISTRKEINELEVDLLKSAKNIMEQKRDTLFAKRKILEQQTKDIEKKYPLYKKLKGDVNVTDLHIIKEKLRSDGALLSFMVSADQTCVFFVDKQSTQIKIIEITKIELDALAANFKLAITENDTSRIKKLGKNLYQLLIQPFQKYLTNVRHLLVIPDAALFKVPFEALVIDIIANEAKYLVEKYNVQYHLSATMAFGNLLELPKQNFSKELIAFAPVFDFPAKYAQRNPIENDTIRSLPYSLKEIQEMYLQFTSKGLTCDTFLRSGASKKNLFSMILDSRILHFSTHGFYDREIPNYCGLVLYAGNEKGQIDFDDLLFSDEIFNLKLNAELVVINSCSSGMGKFIIGEGILAMCRGFLYHNVRNIIHTLWDIDDADSYEFIIRFYQNYLSGMNYQTALHKAKKQFIAEKKPPLYWASTVLLSGFY